MPSWRKVIVSGSDAALNSLNVSTTLVVPSITGSLFGTASWANNAVTASFFSGSIANAVSASYALTASYATNIQISGSINNVQVINFATGSDQPTAEGRLGWDDGYGTLNLGLKGGNVNLAVGQELFVRAFNAEATTLTKGTVVYISGSQGNRVSIKRASAIAEAGSANTLGFVAEEILSGAEGFVQTEGPLNELNTLGLTAGGLVYLSASAGLYTQTPPQAPLQSVRLGYVERVNATVGSIYVKIDNGYEIDELHDVLVTNPTNGDLLVRSGSLWLNTKQLTGSYAITGSLNSTLGFTGSLLGTASWASNAISASFAATSSNVLGGTTNYITVWRGSTTLSSSIIYENDLKIGIGTTGPGSRLEVDSFSLGNSVAGFNAPSNGGVLSFKTSGTERANLFWRYTINQGTGGNYLLLSNNENGGNLALQTRTSGGVLNSNALVIDSTGNVGIAVTSPSTKLHVSASTGGVLEVDGAGTAGANALYVSASGTVGIGTSTPSRDLQVGDLSSSGTATPKTLSLGGTFSTTAGANIKLKVYDSSGGAEGGMSVSSNQMEVNTWSAGKIAFYRGTTQTMIIDDSSRVGIGTSTPQQKLVVSNAGAEGLEFIPAASSNANHIQSYNRSTSAYNTIVTRALDYNIQIGTTSVMFISSSGNVGIGTTTPTTTLDVNGTGKFTAIVETSTRTLKENILPYSTDLGKFKKLQPVSFNWKDTKKEDVGLIAEEVQELFPEFVSKTAEGDVTGINYGKLAAIFINVLKQQQDKIEELEEKIKNLTK